MGLFDSIMKEATDLAKRAAREWADSKLEETSGSKPSATEGNDRPSGGYTTPEFAAAAVNDWTDAGRPRQKPIAWPKSEWMKEFPDLAPMLSQMSNPLSRSEVRDTVRRLPNDEAGAVAAFVACMAWGYGRTGYGRSRTMKVLESSGDAPRKLAKARAIASRGGLRAAFDAYQYLAGEGRLDHLGPAFGTKFIYFHNADGLILDKLTAEWYQRASGIDLKPTQWNPSKYREYLAFMGGWADSFGLRPDELEEVAFSQISRESRNQWA